MKSPYIKSAQRLQHMAEVHTQLPTDGYVRRVEGFPAHQQAVMLESSRWTHVPTSSERHLCKICNNKKNCNKNKTYVFTESEGENLIIAFTAYKTVTCAFDSCH